MPRLMGKKDWMQTVADVGTADSIWYESITADGGLLPLAIPENGMYHAIDMKRDVGLVIAPITYVELAPSLPDDFQSCIFRLAG